MNIRFVLFMAFIWLGFTVVGNLTDGDNYIKQADVDDLATMSEYTTTDTTNALDQAIQFVSTGLAFVGKITTFDYSMFKDVNNPDPVTGEPQDNDFVILRYALVIMGIVCVADIALIMFGRAPA